MNALVYWYTSPSIEISIDSHDPFVIAAPQDDTKDAVWIRIRAHNIGWKEAESARAYLTDLSKDGQSIFKDDALLLYASSNGDEGSNKPLTIARGFRRYFDILWIKSPEDEMRIPSDQFISRARARLTAGQYDLTVWVSGTNFPPSGKKIKVKYDGGNRVSIVSASAP